MKPVLLLYRPPLAVHITNAGFAVFIKGECYRMSPLSEWEEDLQELSFIPPKRP